MKPKAIALILTDLVLMLMDGAVTYVLTPDLATEANPLVSVFSLGWTALFVANAVVFALYVVAVWYTHVTYKRPLIQETSYTRYISTLLYGRPDRFRWVFYRLRGNCRAFLAAAGYMFGYSMIVARLCALYNNFMILLGSTPAWYRWLVETAPFGRPDIWASLVVVMFLLLHWFLRECRQNRKALAALGPGLQKLPDQSAGEETRCDHP